MAKADLGTKRTCPNCGTKYYDLNRDPIVCPKCGAFFEASAKARPAAAVVDEDEVEVEAEGPEIFVPLEQADEEIADTGAVKIEDEDEELADEEEADDTFLEEEDEEGDDVSGIIGDVDEEER